MKGAGSPDAQRPGHCRRREHKADERKPRPPRPTHNAPFLERPPRPSRLQRLPRATPATPATAVPPAAPAVRNAHHARHASRAQRQLAYDASGIVVCEPASSVSTSELPSSSADTMVPSPV